METRLSIHDRLGVVSVGLGLYSILIHHVYYVDMTKTWAPEESCKPLKWIWSAKLRAYITYLAAHAA